MKKVLIITLILCLTIFPSLSVLAADTNPVTGIYPDEIETNEVNKEKETSTPSELLTNAKSGLLMEATTGEILFEKQMDERIPVASMTKMMAQILILESIENGTLTWDEKITTSSNAAGMGGSQIWLQPNEVMTVRDLMKGISMASANDATVLLAERISGTEASFVEAMNKKALELGLKNTHFMNSTGLDEENHYSSSHDLGLIAKELLQHPSILEFSSVYEDYLRTDTANKFWLVNTNKLIRTYKGADGLKTGHTDAALYCMSVTAKKDNLRLIAVVLGEENSKVRNKETAALLDYGFNNYKMQLLKAKGEVLGTTKIDKGNKDQVIIVAKDDIGIVTKKAAEDAVLDTKLELNSIKIPVKPGDVVGKVLLTNNGGVVGEYPVTVKEEVTKAKFFKLYFRIIKEMLTGNRG
ncbi:MAG: D-alanyl-D-alanine carboxypeptidase family protein [Bacilli bacterium]